MTRLHPGSEPSLCLWEIRISANWVTGTHHQLRISEWDFGFPERLERKMSDFSFFFFLMIAISHWAVFGNVSLRSVTWLSMFTEHRGALKKKGGAIQIHRNEQWRRRAPSPPWVKGHSSLWLRLIGSDQDIVKAEQPSRYHRCIFDLIWILECVTFHSGIQSGCTSPQKR